MWDTYQSIHIIFFIDASSTFVDLDEELAQIQQSSLDVCGRSNGHLPLNQAKVDFISFEDNRKTFSS